MDYKILITTKMQNLEKIREELATLETSKNKLLQEGLELQGAIKQLNELMQAAVPTSSATETPAA